MKTKLEEIYVKAESSEEAEDIENDEWAGRNGGAF